MFEGIKWESSRKRWKEPEIVRFLENTILHLSSFRVRSFADIVCGSISKKRCGAEKVVENARDEKKDEKVIQKAGGHEKHYCKAFGD